MPLRTLSSSASATDAVTARYATSAPKDGKRLDWSVEATVVVAIGASPATAVWRLDPVAIDLECWRSASGAPTTRSTTNIAGIANAARYRRERTEAG
jgi:hypothetical protein